MLEMSKDDLIQYILSIPAEDRRTEFKRLGKDFNIKKITESIVAMANTDGGIVILGVDDPQKTRLKGLERVYGIEKNPDTSKVSRLLKQWVYQGLLIKIDTGAKKTVKYRVPIDEKEEYLFAKGNTNKT